MEKAMGSSKKNTVMKTTRVSEEEAARMDAEAAKMDRSVASYLRQLHREHIERQSKKEG
jgi:flagellar motor switch protein FliG